MIVSAACHKLVNKKKKPRFCRGSKINVFRLAVADDLDGQDNLDGGASTAALEGKGRDGKIVGVEYLGVTGDKLEDRTGGATELDLDVLGAVRCGAKVLNLDELGETAVSSRDVNNLVSIGKRVRRSYGVSRVTTEDQAEGVLFGNVRVDTAVIRDHLDDGISQSNLRVSESLPVVAIRKRGSVLEVAEDAPRAANTHRPLNRGLHLRAGALAHSGRSCRSRVQIQLTLVYVV